MSLNPDIRDRAYQFFIEEAQELLQVLEDGLLTLKEDRSTSKVHELMRAAHSIKGGAASVELDTIELIAHRLEDFFKALYSEQIEFDTHLESLLLQAYDGLQEPLTEQMENGSFNEEAALLTVEPIFQQLEEILGEALKEADNYIPSATDLGVDIVASIFEIDVQQSLEHLSAVIDNPEQFDVAGELNEQLEVLGGFAELFTLPGFSEIIDLGTIAIANSPQRALEITRVFVRDCQAARTAILNGDRERGGEASPELIAIARGEPAPANKNPILNALDSGIANESSSQDAIESDKRLSDLFRGDFSTPDEDAAGEAQFASVDDVFGNFSDDFFGDERASEDEPAEDELNIFEFIPEEDDATVIDWEKTHENVIPEPPSEENEAIHDFDDDLEDVFSLMPDENAFAAVEVDLVELGSKILNGEVESIAESQFFVPEETTFEFSEAAEEDIAEDLPETEFPIVENSALHAEDNEAKIEDLPETKILALEIDRSNVVINSTSKESQTSKSSEPETEFKPPENLDTALDEIGNIFEQLPPAKTAEIITESKSSDRKNLTAKTKSHHRQALPNSLSVRVDLERLERMNNLIGELLINRNSLALQNDRIQNNVKNLNQKFSRFRSVTGKLRDFSDRMLVESEHFQTQVSSPETADFDSLEMDSYNRLQILLQDILEEVLQLEEGVDDIFLFAQQTDYTINAQRQMLGQMRDELMWARMLPLEQILKRFPRTLRDLSERYQKPVNLNLIGTGVLVDKAVLEKLYDPLLHLLRNGFDHGIENPKIRRQQGKPEAGQIEIDAYYQGNQTIIEVRDDGKGIDIQKIAEKAIKKGLISPTEVANASQERIFDLIFEAGFSTAEKVSEISGRGVGMSVVKEQIEALNGTISVASTPGKGSTFTLSLPLTLTIAKLLVVAVGETAFALPSDSIEEIIIPLPERSKISNNQRFLFWNDCLIAIYNLQEILQYNCTVIPLDNNSKVFDSVNAPQDWALPLLLLRRGKQFFALEIDRLVVEQELVVKPFGKILNPPNYIYGCTILGDGTLVPVLNGTSAIAEFLGETIVESSHGQTNNLNLNLDLDSEEDTQPLEAESIDNRDSKILEVKQHTIMIVDDSTALRRTMALSLERQGYRIIQAKDGRDALERLQKNSDIDLIVCDVEMPHMNGFEFLGVRRRDTEMKKIPIIMLTSRSGPKHRNLANQLGANGYFTKPYVEQEFLKELNKILDDRAVKVTKRKNKTASIKPKNTVLVVDDSSALRKTMSLTLEKKGYRVLEARDGEEGLEQMYQNPDIALVICDIEMPKMNGFEVLTTRRKDPQLKKMPVAMLTSRSNPKHRNLANQLGADAYFTKPYTENDFMVEIDKLIKKNLLKD